VDTKCILELRNLILVETLSGGKGCVTARGSGCVPNLVAIPNMLVDLLRNQGSVVTPYDVLASIDDFVQQSGEPGHQWEYARKWCLVAGQSNANGKSKVFLDTIPVTVDDEDFDRWVGTRLDIAFGPRPSTSAGPAAGMTGKQPAMDFLALSQMLSTIIGTNMMQFSRAVTGPVPNCRHPKVALVRLHVVELNELVEIHDRIAGVPIPSLCRREANRGGFFCGPLVPNKSQDFTLVSAGGGREGVKHSGGVNHGDMCLIS